MTYAQVIRTQYPFFLRLVNNYFSSGIQKHIYQTNGAKYRDNLHAINSRHQNKVIDQYAKHRIANGL